MLTVEEQREIREEVNLGMVETEKDWLEDLNNELARGKRCILNDIEEEIQPQIESVYDQVVSTNLDFNTFNLKRIIYELFDIDERSTFYDRIPDIQDIFVQISKTYEETRLCRISKLIEELNEAGYNTDLTEKTAIDGTFFYTLLIECYLETYDEFLERKERDKKLALENPGTV